MSKRWAMGLGVVMVAGTLVAVATAGAGWGRGPMMGGGPGGGPGACWQQVPATQLTPEQQQKLESIRQQHWQEMEPMREQMWAKRQEMWSLRSQPGEDPEAVAKLQKEMFQLGQSMREKGFAFHQEVQKIDPNLRCGMGGGFGPRGMGPGMGHGPCGHGGPGWGASQ